MRRNITLKNLFELNLGLNKSLKIFNLSFYGDHQFKKKRLYFQLQNSKRKLFHFSVVNKFHAMNTRNVSTRISFGFYRAFENDAIGPTAEGKQLIFRARRQFVRPP